MLGVCHCASHVFSAYWDNYPVTALLALPSLRKRPIKVPNLKPLRLLSFAWAGERIFIRLRSIESTLMLCRRTTDNCTVCSREYVHFSSLKSDSLGQWMGYFMNISILPWTLSRTTGSLRGYNYDLFACVHAGLSSHQKPTLAKSAYSLTPQKSPGGRKAKHVTLSPIMWLHARSSFTLLSRASALTLRHRLSFSNVGYGQKGFKKIAAYTSAGLA